MEFKNSYKAIILYAISLICILLYLYIDNEEFKQRIASQGNSISVKGAGSIISYGLFKIIFITSGISIPIVVTYMLIRDRNDKKKGV